MSYLYAQSHTAAQPRSPYAQSASIMPTAQYTGTSTTVAPAGSYAATKSPYMAPATIGAGTMFVPTTPAAQTQLMSPTTAPATYLPTGGQLIVGAAAAQQAAPAQPFNGNVQAGSVTYTTTTDALGRVTYHHFRAEPALYRSPQGVTYTGIQWVPTETSASPPIGIAPAGPDILASFRGQLPGAGAAATAMSPTAVPMSPAAMPYGDEAARDREWEREERRRKKEDRKREAAIEADRYRERLEDAELRRARGRDTDAEHGSRAARRSSVGYGLSQDLKADSYGARARSRSRARDPARERELREREERDLERRMDEMSMNNRVGYGDPEYRGDVPPPPGGRSRRQSMSAPRYEEYAEEPDREYDEYDEAPRRRSNVYGGGRQSRPTSMYGGGKDIYAAPERDRDYDRGFNSTGRSRPGSMYAGAGAGAGGDRSPYRAGMEPPQTDVYPPGHIMSGQTMSGYGGGLSASPRHGGGAIPGLSPRAGGVALPGHSPRVGGSAMLSGGGGYGMPHAQPHAPEMLSSPDAFTRPVNRAQTFTPFNMLPVTDMDDFLRDIIHPRPAVLGTHDVQPEDWGRLMNDLALAWQNRLPLPSDGPTKRSDLVIDLLDLWNQQFFLPRNVELALYKGRTPRSGSGVGRPENRLLPEQLAHLSQEAELGATDTDSDSDDEYAQGYGRHGRDHNKALRAKKKLEAKVQREMEMGKRYSLWLLYVPPAGY